MIPTTRAQRQRMKTEAARRPVTLTRVHPEHWPIRSDPDPRRLEVWLSRDYLVQVFLEAHAALRISVSRTAIRPDGRWEDGITWDALQEIKRAIGLGDRWAVEVYPADSALVNDANMRHLWVLFEAPEFAWRRGT